MSATPARLPAALARSRRVFRLSQAVLDGQRLSGDEEVDLDALAVAIAAEPALASRILRFANSALYGAGTEVTSLQRAALVLGTKTLQTLVLSSSVATTVAAAKDRLTQELRLQERTLACAVAGRTLARRAGLFLEDEAFLCGLLSEMGRLVLAQTLPERYAEVVRQAQGMLPTLDVERRMLGFDHTDVRRELLHAWKLPQVICRVVDRIHRSEHGEPLPPPLQQIEHVMSLSSDVADLLLGVHKGAALARAEERAERCLGITVQELAQLVSALEETVAETSSLLSLASPPRPYAAAIARARDEQERARR
jgi:HD-like signal output (HDOD) protein